MYSVDIIAVKHYFDAHSAGLYAGIAAVARIIFFLTASITLVMMPSIRSHGKPRDNQAMLGKSFILLSSIGGAALLVFCLAPHFVIGHLMGKTYEAYAKLLPRLSLAVFLISVLNLFVNYHLALRRYTIALIAAVGMAVTVACLYLSHATLTAVVNSLLSGSTAMFLALGTWIGAMSLRQHKEIRLWRNS
jgi:O-antigen/teichoic acid export membrane protein